MFVGLSLDELMEYTEWQRGKWREWFSQQGAQVLTMSIGPHGDGRFEKIGDLVRHIFGAEHRYVDILSAQTPADVSAVPTGDIDALFDFGVKSRSVLKEFASKLDDGEWNTPRNFRLMDFAITASPKKVLCHVLMHEIRHWAQIQTMLRFNGLVIGFHDLLGSPVAGGQIVRQPASGAR